MECGILSQQLGPSNGSAANGLAVLDAAARQFAL